MVSYMSVSSTAHRHGPSEGAVVAERYKLIAHLGVGATGNTYCASDQVAKRTVAIKVLHARYGRESRGVEVFQHEVRAISSLRSTGFAAVLDHGVDSAGNLFYVSEYYASPNLRSVRAGGPLSNGRLFHLGSELLSALARVHAEGCAHGDLKPEHVLVVPE